jgi:hypothetical protein
MSQARNGVEWNAEALEDRSLAGDYRWYPGSWILDPGYEEIRYTENAQCWASDTVLTNLEFRESLDAPDHVPCEWRSDQSLQRISGYLTL